MSIQNKILHADFSARFFRLVYDWRRWWMHIWYSFWYRLLARLMGVKLGKQISN